MRARKRPGYRYSVIPADAITDPNVTAQALRVLALLGRHTNDHGWCRRSQVKMADELGCSRATVQRALECLFEAGYLERRAEGRPGIEPEEGQQPFASYSYRVKLDTEDQPEKTEEEQARAEVPANEHPKVPAREHPVPALDEHGVPISRAPITEPSLCERSPLEQSRARLVKRYGEPFAKFVEAYDPPAGCSLATAFEAWQTLEPEWRETAALAYAAGIDRQRHLEQQRRENRSVPRCHPDRWLRERRFETCMPEDESETDDGRARIADLFGPQGVARVEQLNGRAREFFDIAAKSSIEPGDPTYWRVPSPLMRERLTVVFADALRDLCPEVVVECGAA